MKANPKTVKIGHAHFDLKLLKDIVANLPQGDVTITCAPCKPHPKGYRSESVEATSIKVIYPNGRFTLNAGSHVSYYWINDKKVKKASYFQFTNVLDDQMLNLRGLSLLSVDLPLHGTVLNKS